MATDYGLLTARLRWIQDHSDELEEGDGLWRLGKKMATLAPPDSALVVDRLSENRPGAAADARKAFAAPTPSPSASAPEGAFS
jgi:hypothetical protein